MRHNHEAPLQDKRLHALSLDPELQALKNGTKAELDAYIDARANTLPEMKNLVKQLAQIVQYLYNKP